MKRDFFSAKRIYAEIWMIQISEWFHRWWWRCVFVCANISSNSDFNLVLGIFFLVQCVLLLCAISWEENIFRTFFFFFFVFAFHFFSSFQTVHRHNSRLSFRLDGVKFRLSSTSHTMIIIRSASTKNMDFYPCNRISIQRMDGCFFLFLIFFVLLDV